MTFVSYAQNFEDVVLRRALRDVERGFYVDVGAQDPVVDSVTRAFYERGWRGINVEPVRHWHERLCEDRPEDVNLRVVVGAEGGTVDFHEVEATGLSTLDAKLAAAYAGKGHHVTNATLERTTLDAILARHAQPVIHFLKIDVEGAEADVLRGLSLRRWRPWILVIEAWAPNQDIETHAAWERDVLGAEYRLVYEDGLNRFYLAEEQRDRAIAFAYPPNVRDGFIQLREHILTSTVAQRDAQLEQWQARAGELAGTMDRVQRLADARSTELESVTARLVVLSDQIERVQQLADGTQRRAEAEKAHATQLQARLAVADARLEELAGENARLEQHVTELQQHVNVLGSNLISTQAELSLARDTLRDKEAFIAQVLGSRSWRLTRPLRVLGRLLRNGPGEIFAFLGKWPERRSVPDVIAPAQEAAAEQGEYALSDAAEAILQRMDASRSSVAKDGS